MKFFKLLLSLDSLRLIAISALAITYLATATANGSNKTEAVKDESTSIVREESERSRVDNVESLKAKIEINAIASQRPDQDNEGR